MQNVIGHTRPTCVILLKDEKLPSSIRQRFYSESLVKDVFSKVYLKILYRFDLSVCNYIFGHFGLSF